ADILYSPTRWPALSVPPAPFHPITTCFNFRHSRYLGIMLVSEVSERPTDIRSPSCASLVGDEDYDNRFPDVPFGGHAGAKPRSLGWAQSRERAGRSTRRG